MVSVILDKYGKDSPFKSHTKNTLSVSVQTKTQPQTQGATSVGPSSNWERGQLFYSLNSACVITCRAWTAILMPLSIITCINKLAVNQPCLLTLTNRHGNEIEDNNIEFTPTTFLEILGVVADTVKIPGVDGANTAIENKNDQNIMPPTMVNEATDEHDINVTPPTYDLQL